MVASTQPAVQLTETWSQIATGVTEVSITLEGDRSAGAVIRIADAQPPSNEVTGHTLTGLHRACPISGLSTTQRVWARAVTGTAVLAIS